MLESIDVLFVLEMIGTVAFAASGAMVAIRKNLDLLGILVLGVITAVGGGMIRDLLIGVHPPAMFTNPIYVEVAFVSILLIFYLVKINASTLNILQLPVYEAILNLMDAIGLGVFTIIGVNTGIREGYANYHFLLISLGVITGVGGGLLRDIMAMQTPAILRKHVYACASLAGAICYVLLHDILGVNLSMVICTLLVILIRVLARHYEWNLPKAT